jgi:hypothetical protein
LQFKKLCSVSLPILLLSLLPAASPRVFAQPLKSKSGPPSPRRISYAEAQKLLVNEREGNLNKQPGKFSRTRLSDGRVLEVFYPITVVNPARRGRTATAPGYGMLYESEAAFKDSTRPRHALEDLIPDGRFFVSGVPTLVARLEKRLGTKLDYSRASLRRLDAFIAGYLSSHTTAETDPRVFQEVTAYYGEVLRRSLNGEWKVREEKVSPVRVQAEPNIAFMASGKPREIKPWSSVLSALSNEDVRGVRLSKIFDDDLKSAQ